MRLPWETYDIHVHCRDEEQSEKATIASTLSLAKEQGVDIIGDMPNPKRPVIDRYRVRDRLALVPLGEEDRYRLWVGLTGEREQAIEAIWCYDKCDQVIGLKLYAGKSVGDLSVTEMTDQFMVYKVLTELNYRGVVAVHCESESFMDHNLFSSKYPFSHTWARPPQSEVTSVCDQIMLAFSVGFKGRLHICHVSCPESVDFVWKAKKSGMQISCGVTPHHIMWDSSMMNRSDGLIYKMNPPLRDEQRVIQLRQQLLEGMIDVVETDHAPHTAEEKAPPLCMSGYPSLNLYRYFITKFLPELGLTQTQIKALTRDNALNIFGDKL